LLSTGDLQVACDSVRVSQALSNLITNAVQYKAKDSAIDVTARGNAQEVLLAVRNWGPVIPADKLTRIVDPLYRIDIGTAATAGRNMGLGLYIADRVAAAHGGRLDVESSSDQGTTFTLRVPRRAAVRIEPTTAIDR
jgi:signal transduction histidine kinase